MSQENVEMVRRWVAPIARGDAEELVEIADPHVDCLPYLGSVSGEHGAYPDTMDCESARARWPGARVFGGV
jgi:hypothetical protein